MMLPALNLPCCGHSGFVQQRSDTAILGLHVDPGLALSTLKCYHYMGVWNGQQQLRAEAPKAAWRQLTEEAPRQEWDHDSSL
jgi:hypothetical protein